MVAQQDSRAFLISKVGEACCAIQTMLRTYRKTLLRILHKDRTSEHEPPEDEVVDSLLLESEIAIEKAIASVREVKPEKMTREWMETTNENIKTLVKHSKAAQRQLDLLIGKLEGKGEESARKYIQLLLEKNK